MKCDDIRAELAMLRPDSRDADQAEFASALSHLQHCSDCQTYWETQQQSAQQQSDRELGRAIRNVSIPADFKSRLLAQLSAAIEAPIAASATVEPVATEIVLPTTTAQPLPRTRPADGAWTRRRASAVASAALLLLAFGTCFFLSAPRRVQLSVDELLALAQSPEAFSTHFVTTPTFAVLPSTEIQTPSGEAITSKTVRSVRYQGQEIGMLIPYSARLGRGKLQSVVLMIIELDPRRVLVSNLQSVGTSFVTARVEYPPPKGYATRIWRVGDHLYVCYVQSSDAEDLDRLKTQNVVS